MEGTPPRNPSVFVCHGQASKDNQTASSKDVTVLLIASQSRRSWNLTTLEYQVMNSSLSRQAALQLCGFDGSEAHHGLSHEEGEPDKVNVNGLTSHSYAVVRVVDHPSPYHDLKTLNLEFLANTQGGANTKAVGGSISARSAVMIASQRVADGCTSDAKVVVSRIVADKSTDTLDVDILAMKPHADEEKCVRSIRNDREFEDQNEKIWALGESLFDGTHQTTHHQWTRAASRLACNYVLRKKKRRAVF